ncbi:molecular chaperone DnaJ [Jatrophihabitans endophyticus]|uniref:Chaperone protein DnaJ n=1 Tax=Jatrophihabitans endophyticus TaxID=1206085 RepID=A0A1M5IPH2_9ACTN|nr:molecular chaperone DnaJ [Jatrophihabitans endophyticus]SHG30155.1 molecular chaperone DnaJ [Jatrophihabitans endophyticus]
MANVEKDYYAALGVAKDASQSEVKKAYRKLARDNHPDTHPGDTAAEGRFKDVSEAYGVLSDTAKRAEYDEQRALFAGGGPRFGGGGGGFPGGGASQSFDMSDLFGGQSGNINDLFDGLFGGGGGGRTRTTSGPRRGRDVNATVDLGFDEAVRGTTLPLKLSSPGACRNCHGSGARPGTTPRRCPTCGGSGSVVRNQGGFGFSEPCVECRGTGQLIDDPCPVCAGSGTTTETRTITVRIPAGVRDGAKVRVPGKGTPGANGGPAGDLFVTVAVGTHRLFGRAGNDLTLAVPISFTEAALGTTLRVPTLDAPVSLRIAPGTPSGRTLRVRGRGVPTKSGAGDLLVTVEVAVPPELDDTARAALQAYAATQAGDPRPEITAALGAATGSAP